MIFKSFHHPLISFQMSFGISGIFRQSSFPVSHSVRFDIGFTDQINTILITQIVPFRIIRIMTGTDCIQIILFHNLNILNHPFTTYIIPCQRIHFMTVCSFKQHRFTVHPYLSQIFFQLDFPESDTLRDNLQYLTGSIF